jgi:hypothetical protein
MSGGVFDVLQFAFLAAGVAAGLFFLLPANSDHERFKREHPYVMDFYTSDEHRTHERQKTVMTSLGVAVIIAGLVMSTMGDAGGTVTWFGNADDYSVSVSLAEDLFSGFFLMFVAVGVGIIVWAQIRHGLTDVLEYNKQTAVELDEDDLALGDYDEQTVEHVREIWRRHRRDQVKEAVCGLIILIATAVGLIMLFTGEHGDGNLFWLAWVIGGLLCGVADLAIDLVWKMRSQA